MSIDIMPAPAAVPVLPELSPEVGEQIGDDILMGAAAGEKSARVSAGSGRSVLQSHQARAWTMGGDVD